MTAWTGEVQNKEATVIAGIGASNKFQAEANKFQAEVMLHYHNACPGVRRIPMGDPVSDAGRMAVTTWAQTQGTFDAIVSKAKTADGLKQLERGLTAQFEKFVSPNCYHADGIEIRALSKPDR